MTCCEADVWLAHVPLRGRRDVPSYFFVIKSCYFEDDDENGTMLRDDRQAQIHALRIIRELKEGGGYDSVGWAVIVFGEAGRQVCTVPFSLISIPSHAGGAMASPPLQDKAN
jgi:hypothetical protein